MKPLHQYFHFAVCLFYTLNWIHRAAFLNLEGYVQRLKPFQWLIIWLLPVLILDDLYYETAGRKGKPEHQEKNSFEVDLNCYLSQFCFGNQGVSWQAK